MGINLNDKGYNDVQPANHGDFYKLPADGYVCKIINAELTNSKAGNPMLVLCIDVAEGHFTGFFRESSDKAKKFDPNKKWDNSGIYRQLLFDNTQRVSPFFKGLMTSIEKSNDNFKVNLSNFEPSDLQGLLCGFVFANEEYEKRDGSIAERTVIKFPKVVLDIRQGNFKIPDTKKLQKFASNPVDEKDPFNGVPVNPDDVPF